MRRRSLGWLMLVLALAGCGSYRTLPLAAAVDRADPALPASQLRYGDRVRITLKDGSIREGVIETVAPALVVLDDADAQRQSILATDVAALAVYRPTPTLVKVGAGALVAAGLVLVLTHDSSGTSSDNTSR